MRSSLARLLIRSSTLLALALALAGRGVALAGEPAGCEGTLSGDVKASFACAVVLGTQAGGERALVISAPGPVDGVASLVPGGFQLPRAPRPGTYSLAELGMGKASVAVEGGALYTAARTSSVRGEVSLTLTSVRKSRRVPGAYEVHGTYRARLVPAGGGRRGEVVVDVRF